MQNQSENEEMLNIFDDHKQPAGVATREEVHRMGYWHETFHCWFITLEGNQEYIYFQLRSPQKQDYPNLLDITAAGHLTADETVQEGTREIKEELGIDVSCSALEPLGILDYRVEKDGFIDKEIAHVYLHRYSKTFHDFSLSKEEVTGVFKALFTDFYKLWLHELNEINIVGFEIDQDGNGQERTKKVMRDDFVPHESSFYRKVNRMIWHNIM